jgi:hypothetical protein
LARSYLIPLEDAAARVFYRTLPPDLQHHLTEEKWLGEITYIDFRKDWSPHFKRLCIFPDGRLVETSGLTEFTELHGITVAQAKALVEEGGTLEVDGEVLACQIVNSQPAVARFNHRQYARAKEIATSRGLHLLDALSEVGLSDPAMMRALKRLEARLNL